MVSHFEESEGVLRREMLPENHAILRGENSHWENKGEKNLTTLNKTQQAL